MLFLKNPRRFLNCFGPRPYLHVVNVIQFPNVFSLCLSRGIDVKGAPIQCSDQTDRQRRICLRVSFENTLTRGSTTTKYGGREEDKLRPFFAHTQGSIHGSNQHNFGDLFISKTCNVCLNYSTNCSYPRKSISQD